MITINDQIKCVERELQMRRTVYSRRIEQRRMSYAAATREIELMEEVLKTLRSVPSPTPQPMLLDVDQPNKTHNPPR